MPIIDFVKWNGTPDLLAWKYPSEELSTYTQLVVNESQEAFLVREGKYQGPFGPGRHVLSTDNLPLLRAVLGLPFGGQSPFSAEVWFVNKQINLDIKWGTPDPIQIQDAKFHSMVPVRAFGQYGVRVSDSKRFLIKLVGALRSFDVATAENYFRGIFLTKITSAIGHHLIGSNLSVLEIAPQLASISTALKQDLTPDIEAYGLALESFNIISINLKDDDPAVQSLKSALAKKAEMQIVGFDYRQERSFDVLQTAAGNESATGAAMGAGMGLGMGIGVGLPMVNSMTTLASNISTSRSSTPEPFSYNSTKIQFLKELAQLHKDGVLTDEEFSNEKRKILDK